MILQAKFKICFVSLDANSNQITIIVWTKASSVVCLVNVVFFGKIKSIENKRLHQLNHCPYLRLFRNDRVSSAAILRDECKRRGRWF